MGFPAYSRDSLPLPLLSAHDGWWRRGTGGGCNLSTVPYSVVKAGDSGGDGGVRVARVRLVVEVRLWPMNTLKK